MLTHYIDEVRERQIKTQTNTLNITLILYLFEAELDAHLAVYGTKNSMSEL
jgi:hypothetical protein